MTEGSWLELKGRVSRNALDAQRSRGERPRVLKRTSSMVPCTKEVCLALFARPELPSATAAMRSSLCLSTFSVLSMSQ